MPSGASKPSEDYLPYDDRQGLLAGEKQIQGPDHRDVKEAAVSVPRWGLTWTLMMATFSAVVGGSVQFGWATGVMNNAQIPVNASFYEHNHPIPSFGWDFSVSIFSGGGLVGGTLGGVLANRLGRRNALLVNNSMILLGTGLSTFAHMWGMLAAGRFFTGVGAGLATLVVPMYISEISPTNQRGTLGVLNQVGITSGIFISQVIALQDVPGTLATVSLWPWLFAIPAFFSLFQLFTLIWFPKSPSFLVSVGRDLDATKALERFRHSSNISYDLAVITKDQQNRSGTTSLRVLLQPAFRRALLVAIVAQLGQQLSYINAVFYYSSQVFASAGVKNPSIATAGIGGVNVVVTLLVTQLMDRTGRKALTIIGHAGMALSFFVLAFTFIFKENAGMSTLAIIMVVCVVVFFALGPGPVPWLLMSEIFGLEVREGAMSVCVAVNWIANFIVGISFPSMQSSLGDYTFFLCAAFNVAFALFGVFFLPETKGKTIEEIQHIFSKLSAEPQQRVGAVVYDPGETRVLDTGLATDDEDGP